MPKTPENFEPQEQENEYISYLGVRLEKAENRENAPDPEKYADYIEDEFSLELQRDIAIAFEAGDPILIEGGTSIGKTTTAKKMASELGWEVHYMNLNGASDVEDIMGRYTPNPDKKGPSDPEFIFADGKVTSGIRPEEGKKKIILLDEFNSAAPNIVIRLHEVLDALERGGEVVLSENASAKIQVDKENTKIIALTNPPGKGYFGREPLDPAQLRRWVYKKAPSSLPDEMFSHSVDALYGMDTDVVVPPEDKFINSRETELTHEELDEIPGIEEVLELYKEFHRGAKALVAQRQIGEDQPQLFTYDDRMEPKRVMNFVRRYYNGDITETFQQALRYYYVNKLEGDEDREKLEELVRHVKYTPKPGESKRVSIEDLESTEGEIHTERLEKETLDEIEDFMTHFLSVKGFKGQFAVGMAGMDSDRAWGIRDELKKHPEKLKYLPYSLAGLDSLRAQDLRDYLSEEDVLNPRSEGISFIGVDNEEAWDWRDTLFGGEFYEAVAESLAGIDSDRANVMRDKMMGEMEKLKHNDENELLEKYARALSESLIGLDTDESWEIRAKIFAFFGKEGVEVAENIIGEGIAGVNSKQAWDIRKHLLENGGKKEKLIVLESLIGLDSDAAWEIRAALLKEGGYEKAIAASLAGLKSERADGWRSTMLPNAGLEEEDIIVGISGDYRMEAVRKIREAQDKKKITEAGSKKKGSAPEF